MSDFKRPLLIVPCFNEADRMNPKAFTDIEADFLFANDGSTDQTADLLAGHVKNSDNAYFFDCPKNVGKANVIQAAYQWAKENSLLEKYDWIGFWDADLATPLREVENMFRYHKLFSPNSQAVWCSRVLREGSKIKRNPLRHYLARIFATIISWQLNVYTYDSQCGAKLFTRDCAQKAFEKPFISSWIFDVEIYLRISEQFMVLEYPLQQWEDVAGSKVNLKKDIFKVLKELLLLKKTYRP